MNYDTRIAIARDWVANLIARYERPAHLAHDKAKLELADMAEDANSIIPARLTPEQFRSTLDKAARTIRAKNRTRSWPTIALVCQAIRENLPAPETHDQANNAPASLDQTRSMIINANRIKRREPVGQHWVEGRDAENLIAQNLINREDLKPYLKVIATHPATQNSSPEQNNEQLNPATHWQPDLASKLDDLAW